MQSIGILGGTFDPVHHGHLRLALEAIQRLGLSEVRFIPLSIPNHRPPPQASNELRKAMLDAAVADESTLIVDDRELRRPGVSYTVDTLESLREELGNASIALLLGADAFATLEDWHAWQRLIELAHIAVVARPGEAPHMSATLQSWAAARTASNPAVLRETPCGSIVQLAPPFLDISSSGIRKRIADDVQVRYLLPDATYALIDQHKLYRHAG